MNNTTTLTFRDIVDKVTGVTLYYNAGSRKEARRAQRSLKKEGFKPRIIRSEYQLIKTIIER